MDQLFQVGSKAVGAVAGLIGGDIGNWVHNAVTSDTFRMMEIMVAASVISGGVGGAVGGAVGGGFGGAAAGAGAGAATGGLIGGAGYASAGYGTFWQGFTQGAISGAISGGFAGYNAVAAKTPTPDDVAEALKNAPDYEVAWNEGFGSPGDPFNPGERLYIDGGKFSNCMSNASGWTAACGAFSIPLTPASTLGCAVLGESIGPACLIMSIYGK